MRVPGKPSNYRPPPPKAAFDPYEAIAAYLREERSWDPIPVPPVAEPRSMAQPSEPDTTPVAETAEVVDLGEARAQRAPEIDRHAELMGRLAPIEDLSEAMTKLSREFAAANDGSVQASVSDGISTLSKAVDGIKSGFDRFSKSLRESAELQDRALKADLAKFSGEAKNLAAEANSGAAAANSRLLDNLASLSQQMHQVHEAQESMLRHMQAPKRIIRDAKGRAVGSVVDMNLKG